MSLYLRFLLMLLLVRVCDSKTINVFAGTNQAASYLRTKASSEGHVTRIKIEKNERTRHKETLYRITRKGIEYLLVNIPADLNPILFGLLGDSISVSLFEDRHQTIYLREANVAQAMMLAFRSGADIPVENFTLNSEKKEHETAFTQLISALDEDTYSRLGVFAVGHENGGREKKSQTTFHNAAFLKSAVSESNERVSQNDFYSGRYAGILDSPSKSILIYGTPLFGFRWNETMCFHEEAAFTQWQNSQSSRLRSQSAKNEMNAALIVKNPTNFAALFFRKDDKRNYKYTDTLPFGGSYNHFYILSNTVEGANQLKLIASIEDDQKTMNALARQMAAEKHRICGRTFRVNHFNSDGMFPLVDSNGAFTAMGLLMDSKQILRLEKTARKTERMFSLICYVWQVPYYKAVLPPNVVPLGF